ncbi:MAG TPA: AI-2E family transporter [Thermoanaerobaculia bacterium]|jgi:predicted PurR-regulated permease PerM|nr:AI-2E family transporter [Thermoanaerobaculia bacterium]
MLEPIRKEAPEQERPRPDIKKLRDAFQGPFGIRSMALTGLFILAAFYTLYLARAFFLPIILSFLLSFLLSPLVRWLKKLHIPEGLSAALLVFGLLGLLGLGIYELSGPAYEWATQAPKSLRNVEDKLRALKKPVQTVSKATEQVEKITKVAGGQEPAKVTVSTESLGERVFSQATDFISNGIVMFILLYFLLAAGDMFLRKLIKVMPSLSDKKRAVEIARQIETEISAYLATITLINAILGVAVWGIMSLIGLPNALLWGVLAFVTNYIPYLGAIVMIAVLAMVGFLSFDDLGHALMAPGAFVGLNLLESYFLTPMILGRRLTLNPVVIFLGLTFWGWLWGITGAVLAVPIMVVLKIFCDHSEPLAPIGEFLGN